MDISDSESDDFFSGIRSLRRKLGLSAKPAANTTAPANTTRLATPTRAKPASSAPPKPSPRYSQHSKQHISQQAHKITAEHVKEVTNRVTPQEIAALLSPRKHRSRKTRRLSAEQNTQISPKHTIPARSPESRIASPRTPVDSSLEMKRASMDSSSSLGSPLGLPIDRPSEFSVRSLWDGTDPSPLRTPARRRLVKSPLQELSARLPSNANRLSIGRGYAETAEVTGLLGSVEDALITDKDLDHAQRKLGEAAALTQQQIIRELRERIRAFSDTELLNSAAISDWWPSVTLLCQFHTLGHGELGYSENGVLWRGSFVGAIASAVQNQTGGLPEEQCRIEENLLLVFPWHRVSSLRKKSFDDMDHVMMTVDEDMGVAFQIGGGYSIEDIEKRVASMKVCLSGNMALRRQQLEQERLSEDSDSDGAGAGIGTGGAVSEQQSYLIESILRHAVSSHQELFQDLDVSRALQTGSFMKSASDLATRFSQQLATMAVETNNKKRKRRVANNHTNTSCDDPGTETIPGTCTLCYAAEEAVILYPCEHRICNDCFTHLKTMPPTSSQTTSGEKEALCMCPWDRSLISTHIVIK
ncbi:hypothetical protein GGF40_001564 [Coemansia sp. RSA 1286]|nr:hypothetical protein GGF39_001326 [Coemansia sp. RSA 1721]KAJ2638525.1 hypothetical protein GGF40_001564 [Coemansia sp. RSA 1286]